MSVFKSLGGGKKITAQEAQMNALLKIQEEERKKKEDEERKRREEEERKKREEEEKRKREEEERKKKEQMERNKSPSSKTDGTKSKSTKPVDVNITPEEFEKLHQKTHFKHTTVTRKLFPLKAAKLINEAMENVAAEKIKKVMKTAPYKDHPVDKIFQDENLRTMLAKDSELNEDDSEDVYKQVIELASTEEFLDELIQTAQILSDPDKLAAAYFLGVPPQLEEMAKRAIESESERNLALIQYRDASTLTFKLLITSINDYEYEKLSWKSKVKMMAARVLTKWGMNHAALQIGPYIVDWNDSELIIPRYLSSKHAKALIPINDRVNPTKETAVRLICKIICDWNNRYTYDNRVNIDKTACKGNCQHFVTEILTALGINNNWMRDGPVNKYISKISSGMMGTKIIVTDHKGKDRELKAHDDLVKLYEEIILDDEVCKNPAMVDEYEALFKCIERTFQLKHEGNPDVYPEVLDPLFGDVTGKVGVQKSLRDTRRQKIMSQRMKH